MNKKKIKSKYFLSSYFLTSEDFKVLQQAKPITQLKVTPKYSKAFWYRLDNCQQIYRDARVVLQCIDALRLNYLVKEA